jgi:hypothetical protein
MRSLPICSTVLLSRFRAGVVVLVAGLLAVAIASWAGFFVVKQVIDPAQVGPGASGYEWADYHVDSSLRASGFFVIPCDDNAGTARGTLRSELVLFEDGKPLGPDHSFDETIGKVGSGAYSYRCLDSGAVRGLVFSSSDNSDPRTNGRQYLAHYPVKIAPYLLITIVCLSALLAMISFRGYLLIVLVRGVWFIAIATTIYALYEWYSVPVTTLFEPDSLGYINPALSALAGGPLTITSTRSFVYPGFILAILATFGSIPALIYAQAILCLATAAMVATLPLAASIGTKITPAARILRAYLGAGSLLLFYHYGPLAYSIHAVMPEMLYTTLSTMVFMLLILSFRLTSTTLTIICCVVGIYITIANFYVKPSWGVAMVLSVLIFVFRIIIERSVALFIRSSIVLLTAIISLITLTTTNINLSEAYDRYNYKVFGPLTLFCHHAPLIINYIDNHINDNYILSELKNDLTEIISKGPGHDNYNILGYDPNICLYGKIRLPIDNEFSQDPDKISHFLAQIFFHAVLEYPSTYVSKVVMHFIDAINHPMVDISTSMPFNDKSVPSVEKIQPIVNSYLFSDRTIFIGVAAPLLESGVGISVLNIINDTFVIIIVIALSIFTIDLVLMKNMRLTIVRRWTPAGLALGLLVAAIMVVAISNTFDVSRYRYPLFPLVLGTVSLITQNIFDAAQARLPLYLWLCAFIRLMIAATRKKITIKGCLS